MHVSRHDIFIFTAQRYASVVYAVDVCLSARLSVRLSQDGIVSQEAQLSPGGRDAPCQLKFCQLPRNFAETTSTSPVVGGLVGGNV